MALKEHDIVVILKLVSLGDQTWSYSSLAGDLDMSPSGIHGSIVRAIGSKLLDSGTKKPLGAPLEEFLVHGVKYVFPARLGSLTRGMPTGYAAPPLNSQIVQSDDPPPVWPYAFGTARGYAFYPLHKSVPRAAEKDQRLYEMLALLDAIRGGRARERSIAAEEIKIRLRTGFSNSFAEFAREAFGP
jgi:hypothetical protein